MNSLDNLILASKEHSIKEAVITFFLANRIFQPKKYSFLMENDFRGVFQQFELVQKVLLKVTHSSPQIQEQEIEDAGFNFVKFDNGKKAYIIRGINEENRNFYSFHSLKYTKWDDFISSVQKYVLSLLKIQKGSYIMAYSLNYNDEFYWKDKQCFDANLIFKKSDYIPEDILKASVLDYNLNLNKENDGNSYFDRIAIKFQDKITQKVISVGHNITFITERDPIPLDEAVESKSKVLERLNYAHSSNKSFLRGILQEEVIEKIHL